MFTIRFNSRGADYTSHSCRSYHVEQALDEAKVTLVVDDDVSYVVSVGEAHEYKIAYVSNMDSRTIDVIRSPTVPFVPEESDAS